MKPPVELFSKGFAADLHKRAAEELFGGHCQPRKSESAAGKLAATLGANSPNAPQKAHAEAKTRPSCVKRAKVHDPRQMRLKL